jgi:hypothetical protein
LGLGSNTGQSEQGGEQSGFQHGVSSVHGDVAMALQRGCSPAVDRRARFTRPTQSPAPGGPGRRANPGHADNAVFRPIP